MESYIIYTVTVCMQLRGFKQCKKDLTESYSTYHREVMRHQTSHTLGLGHWTGDSYCPVNTDTRAVEQFKWVKYFSRSVKNILSCPDTRRALAWAGARSRGLSTSCRWAAWTGGSPCPDTWAASRRGSQNR